MRELIIFAIIIMSIASFVSASSQQVVFNGTFSNGTTLYSSVYNFSNSSVSIIGKDVYPIRSCIKINVSTTTKKVCHSENRTRVCVNQPVVRTITRCASYPAICYNPYSSKTNQLSLTNFAYSPDNGTSWYTIPYTKFSLSNIYLKFRLIIPSVCKPEYGINNAIKIEY